MSANRVRGRRQLIASFLFDFGAWLVRGVMATGNGANPFIGCAAGYQRTISAPTDPRACPSSDSFISS